MDTKETKNKAKTTKTQETKAKQSKAKTTEKKPQTTKAKESKPKTTETKAKEAKTTSNAKFKQANKKDTKEANKKERKFKVGTRRKIVLTVTITLALIVVISIAVAFILFNATKVENRLKADPSNYYSKTNYYFITGDKIYYYNMDDQDRGRVYSMKWNGSENKLVSSSEKLKTPKFQLVYNNNAYCVTPISTTNNAVLKINLESGAINKVCEGKVEILPETLKDGKVMAVEISDIKYEEPKIDLYEFDLEAEEMDLVETFKPSIDDEDIQDKENVNVSIAYDSENENCYYSIANKLFRNNVELYDSEDGISSRRKVATTETTSRADSERDESSSSEKEDVKNVVVNDEYIFFTQGNKLNRLNKKTKEIKEIKEIPDLDKATDAIMINNHIVIDFDCNDLAKYVFGKLIVYNLENDEYETYDDVKHYDIEGNNIYKLTPKYKVEKIEI